MAPTPDRDAFREPLGHCLWCDATVLPTAGRRSDRKFCSPGHAQKWRRAQRAATLGDLVEALGPHIMDGGIDIYRELVDHLAGTIRTGKIS